MMARRVWQKFAGASFRRRLSPTHACASRAPAILPAMEVYEEKCRPFLPFCSQPRFHGTASASFRISGYCSEPRISHFVKRCCYSSHAVADLPEGGGVVDVPLAQTGEGIAECELLKWFVQEGENVDEFQPLCEVQSDKATIEITSRYKGKVARIFYVPGDIVKVGETLLKMAVEEFQVQTHSGKDFESIEATDTDKKEHNADGVLSTPAVRGLAKQYGVNINDVLGTGKGGRVLKDDLLKYAVEKGILEDSSSSSCADCEHVLGGHESYVHASAGVGQNYEDQTVSLRGFQRKMVQSMSLAAKVPHFHYVEDINCDALVELKGAFQHNNSDPNVKHTFLPVLIKSLSVALSSHNIGVAMATPYGLVVPNIKNVQSLSIMEITKELSRLQKLASDNKLSRVDICGGTITLSNIGAIGGKFGSPLLNLPEVSIIALGRIQKVPHFADDGNVYPASIMTVNIGADHRVLDGATVARFCCEWKKLIEKPELLMLHLR
ncbi:Lipoamide acyltransferase component of branched-chain alpha-keto acid dehydrogenase complex [Morus notabilis]|uniref:Dihydrolipoamide acetyltransferase component of pyruvate dehydrogenase complex n=1 Tax=Morus notabilis TaxID=981085 RepID=W9S1D3_9ROSA|nr:Lipoamide acyltransferase component of branched-chain alpha-keto acid dehydrogenase complex [Morus notabilis]